MTKHDFASATVSALLDRLAADTPTPGGGTAAALAGAMGASLVEMLGRITTGREGYEAQSALMLAVAEQAAEARHRLLAQAHADAEAYDAVLAASRLPRGTAEEKTARRDALRTALMRATAIPLQVMESCVEVIGIAKNAVESGIPNAASDGATGAWLARAGLEGAAGIVRTNLDALEADAEFVTLTRTRIDEMLFMGTKVSTAIDSHVREMWT